MRGGVGRGNLQRNNSSGSMSERTFRSPSPGGRANGAIPAAREAPPVPALPASMRGSHRRSASTEPPQRMMSPTPRANTRGASVDRYGTSARTAPRVSTLPEEDELERQESAGSINYSRPMSVQGHSPIAAPKAMKSGGSWFTAPTGTLSDKPTTQRPTTDARRIQQDAGNIQSDISAAASRPTKKKQIANNTQGTYLARANEPSNTPVETIKDPIMVYDPASRKFITKPRQTAQVPTPPSPTLALPAAPVAKPGEYDPSTRKIVPEIPVQKPSILVSGGDNKATRTRPAALAVEPPPRNPARADQNGSPVSPRAAGLLSKQPSMVREEPEEDQEGDVTGSARSYKRQTNGFSGFSKTTMRSASAAMTPIGGRNRSDSLDVPRSGSDTSGRIRGSSHSPSRSAHFSASPILEFTRHDPPERGVSPAKSAMKHSPSSSIRDNSPMAMGAYSINKAMSETSDTPSMDGSARKKKSVRVSFTEQPQSAEPPFTPAARAAVARKVSPLIDDDMDEIMKPRPDLPSFGSVRQSRLQQEVAEKVTERPPDRRDVSSDHVIGGILAQNSTQEKPSNAPVPPEVTSRSGTGYSSDESDDEATPASQLGAGNGSAKTGSSQDVGPPPQLTLHPAIKISLQPPTPGEEEKNFAEAARAESPPPRPSLERFAVPGSWAAEPEEKVAPVAVPAATAVPAVNAKNDSAKSIADRAIAAPVTHSEPSLAPVPAELQLSDIAESDSDDSAIFSDAEEDLSYMDESGFASMDAIVESPVVKQKAKDSAPESPSLRQAARRTSKDEARPAEDWTNATSYWKQLSKQQREQIERSHLSSDDEYSPAANSLANRPKKKKSALKQPTQVAEPVTASQPPRQAPAQPAKTAMRKSMRGPPEPAPAPTPAVQMRSSLREGGGGGMRSSMRDRPQSEYTASKPALRQSMRPSSSGSGLPVAAAGGAMSRRPQSPDDSTQDGPFPAMQSSASARLAKKWPLPAAPTEDSDSESSFRKKRRPSASNADTAGRFSMKRSMRSGSIDSEQQRPVSPTPVSSAKQRKAFSVRSLSPTGSFFGRKQLKESIRAAPADSGAKTLRGPNSIGGSSAKAQSKPAAAPRQRAPASNMSSKFKSRFADSDDEDDRGRAQKPSFFSSRFADSDDDEPSRGMIQADLTPVRGIPRRRDQQDGDSTDLSDEDDDSPRKATRGRNKQSKPIVPDSADVEKAMAAARRNLGMTNGNTVPETPPVNEGSALSKGSLRKSEQAERPQSPTADSPRKRSFMGSILRRNRTQSNASQQLPMFSPPPPLPNQGTPLASPRPGKLQRRTSTATQDYFANNNPKTQLAGDDANWPLTPPSRPSELRPSTSDGLTTHEQAVRLARQMRPDIGRSQSNSDDVFANGSHVGFAEDVKETNGKAANGNGYSAKTGKKKKFGMLRRAFGLDD
jgi:serine/arginine repetitive matrix protein 2